MALVYSPLHNRWIAPGDYNVSTKEATLIVPEKLDWRSSYKLCFDVQASINGPSGITFTNKWECFRPHSMEQVNSIIKDYAKRDNVMGYTYSIAHSYDRILKS